jgi:hypothetical protein
VNLLPDEFEVSSAFRIEDHFDGWGIIEGTRRERVVVDFAPVTAPYIQERDWPNTVSKVVLPDGWLRLEFETTNLKEVSGWLKSYGAHAVVREPEALAEELLHAHHDAIAAIAERTGRVRRGEGDEEKVTAARTPFLSR